MSIVLLENSIFPGIFVDLSLHYVTTTTSTNKEKPTTEQQHCWNVKKRQMKQLLVRGDMVVSIYEASKERRNVDKSRYYHSSRKGK